MGINIYGKHMYIKDISTIDDTRKRNSVKAAKKISDS